MVGSVAMLTNNALNVSVIKEITAITDNYEVITVQRDLTIFCILYCPPNANLSTLIGFLYKLLGFVSCKKCKLLIWGNINVGMIVTSVHQFQLLNVFEPNSFYNVIETSTQVTCNSPTLIDLCETLIRITFPPVWCSLIALILFRFI